MIPRRGRGDGLLPLDGSDPANRWQGMVPAAQMPAVSNPPEGFLAAANARVNPAGEGPLVSADNAPPYRIARIRQVLGAGSQLTLGDMQALQLDRLDGQAALLLPSLLRETDAAALDPAAAEALALLQQWAASPVAGPGSAAALVFQQWYLALAEQVFAAPLGELYPRLLQRAYLLNSALDRLVLQAQPSPWWRNDKRGLITAALNDAVAALADRLGPGPARWRLDQRLHVALRHQIATAVPALGWLFNRPDVPWGGSSATVGRARYNYARPFEVDTAATVRAVAEMTAAPRLLSVIPGGQSGHPLSPHYADQFPAWLAGELYPIAPQAPTASAGRLTLLPQ